MNTRIFITGGASGLGREIALRWARTGAYVCIGDLHDERGLAVAGEVTQAGGKGLFVHCDVTSSADLQAAADRLVADGVIRGFTIQVDPAIDGMSTEAYVELFCRGTVSPEELLRILSAVPEVVDAGTVTGSADAIVHIRSRDIPSLEAALEKVRLAPNVDHTRSAIVLSRLINRGNS